MLLIFYLFHLLERAKQYKFTTGLPKAYRAEAGKDVQLECFINDKAARVEWKLNGEPIKVNNTLEVFPLLLICTAKLPIACPIEPFKNMGLIYTGWFTYPILQSWVLTNFFLYLHVYLFYVHGCVNTLWQGIIHCTYLYGGWEFHIYSYICDAIIHLWC